MVLPGIKPNISLSSDDLTAIPLTSSRWVPLPIRIFFITISSLWIIRLNGTIYSLRNRYKLEIQQKLIIYKIKVWLNKLIEIGSQTTAYSRHCRSPFVKLQSPCLFIIYSYYHTSIHLQLQRSWRTSFASSCNTLCTYSTVFWNLIVPKRLLLSLPVKQVCTIYL